ncbi:cytochrome P450 [Nonomuraea gerenzanensis]|uniref:Putative cytochrome P450 hydroxylase n=1 Tax=Nonomuraea gerenzanensis TaxID=93944 RepID=A0A1M4EAW3_9ACTN|nr:cytochrome P450 [Nonomuraea gerenzanensis]UBU18264.1 cytochrome P450 [Nonomuraea gerenzanensis]SBO96081.1 putative cytochrome P450 hydroxylase [Nonomuraea gerenzanensis]
MATPAAPNVPFLDVLDPAFDFEAPEVYAAQAESWYADSPFGLLVLRYEEASDLLRDRRLNHDGRRYMETHGITEGPIYDWFVPMIVNHEGEEHRRLRGLMNKAFTARRMARLRPFIREQAEQLTDGLDDGGTHDFVADFGIRLPLAVMCRLLGVRPEDYGHFGTWTADLGLVFGLSGGEDIVARLENAVVGLNDYADYLIDDKIARPSDDLSSDLVAAYQSGDGQVSRDELRNLLVTLVFAAHDTTRHQLANAMVVFSQHPGQWTLLSRQPDLATRAVEEVMRWQPSTGTIYRFAAEDFDYKGLAIERGRYLTMCVKAAQRDPRAYKNADRFDITAVRDVSPLQFGAGPHHCLGAALARVEVSEALSVLATRLGPPSVVEPVTWPGPLGIQGPEVLLLRFG